MTTVARRLERAIKKEAVTWGVRPVPDDRRRLSGIDQAVLWGDLSIGLLVMLTGAYLVPALGVRRALLAIVLGSAIGCLPLALVALAGAREGVTSMVLFRPVLGIRGSYVPSVLNLVQLLGWVAVEFWAMGHVAAAVSRQVFHTDVYLPWLVAVAVVCTLLALGGPVLVVRAWLERFGVYIVAAVGAWITYKALSAGDIGAIWRGPGEGGLPFWLAVDLVIVMPISWLPLAADYSRFARSTARSFGGTYWGYFAGNVWFYALGALLVLSASASVDIGGIGTSVIALAGGTVALFVLLVGESDEAFANIYSSAVSIQNVLPQAPQRVLIVLVAAGGFLLAWFLSMDSYIVFLSLIGSVFVPLFGVFAADYFVLRRAGYDERDLFDPRGRYWFRGGFKWPALVPWAAGFLLYQWSVPAGVMPGWWTEAMGTLFQSWLRLPFPLLGSAAGASIPAFAGAFLLTLATGALSLQRAGAGARRPAE